MVLYIAVATVIGICFFGKVSWEMVKIRHNQRLKKAHDTLESQKSTSEDKDSIVRLQHKIETLYL